MGATDWVAVSEAVEDFTSSIYFEMSERECRDADVDFIIERIRSAVVQHDASTIRELVERLSDFATYNFDRDTAEYVIPACENMLAAIADCD